MTICTIIFINTVGNILKIEYNRYVLEQCKELFRSRPFIVNNKIIKIFYIFKVLKAIITFKLFQF